ncbi:dipeptide ABC transporter ATP-binding protein [Agromyces laixinhei]|uniref:ABC transporter ATP-binding protein/permease n=1 Tax=Agromyces laixinhei TaxID=2585717 RepID=UPI0012EDCF66|nr:dipeptide ABC transporter ATP-binding protein [Agromyces laixinhei]
MTDLSSTVRVEPLASSSNAPDPRASGGAVRPLWRLLARRPQVVVCSAMLAVIIAAVALAPVIAPFPPLAQDLTAVLQGPSAAHPLGTDDLGRDILSRILYGGRSTLLGVAQALLVFLAVGISTGLIAGMARGWLDGFFTRGAEVLLSVPSFIVILVVLTIFPGSMTTAMISVGILTSPLLMRVVRGNTRLIRNELYVRSARSMGLSETQITVRHVLPRLAGPIIVQATIFAGAVIMIETGLGYLGFGESLPNPSWGNLITTASENLNLQPWLLVPTGGIIIITVLCFTLLGDGLRDTVAERWSGATATPRRRRRRSPASAAPPSSTRNAHRRNDPDPAATGSMLRVTGLTVVADAPEGETPLIEDVTFDVRAGETLCLVGESGSGKSITALSILGLTRGPRIARGEVWAGDVELTSLPPEKLAAVRGTTFGYITQDPQPSLDPSKRVGDLLTQLVRLHTGVGKSAARKRSIELIATVGIPDAEAVARRYPHQLSGGMAQRIVIAAALSANPSVLIADEPTTALDVTVQAEILGLLHELCDGDDSMTLLLITHDWGVVADIADRVAVMYRGHIVEEGPVREIFARPQHAFTRGMLDHEPDRQPRRGTASAREAEPLLVVDDLRVHYASRDMNDKKVELRAVKGVSLGIGSGRTLGLVGESGSGKSTVGSAIAGLVPVTGGSIVFDGEEIANAEPARRRMLTQQIQVIFQDPFGSLNPVRPVGSTLSEPLRLAHGLSQKTADERVRATLERVGLDASAAKRYPAQFSGGQRQRVAIARALVLEPRLIICDEPVSALDLSIQAQVLDLLAELQRDLGIAYVFISHDLSVVRNFCDEIAVMYRGEIVEAGETEAVCTAPSHEYTRSLLQAAPVADPAYQAGRSREAVRYTA